MRILGVQLDFGREQIENRPPRTPCINVTQDANKRLTNQHYVESGEINRLEVRVLPGSNTITYDTFSCDALKVM